MVVVDQDVIIEKNPLKTACNLKPRHAGTKCDRKKRIWVCTALPLYYGVASRSSNYSKVDVGKLN